ncbi:hypothetical protein [Rhodocista pekingensis]|uniref:Conjugal transfer protein n=1 Tax=Rhodocista pekingensis TaxID=201185 RepID=A0ABW2KX81_9PROT
MRKPRTAKQQLAELVTRSNDDVFLPRDFTRASPDSAEYDTVLRAARALVREGTLVRLGYGVYARARQSPITGKPMLTAPGGLEGAVRQALDKLKVVWQPGQAAQDYNSGRSTQIPVNASFRVANRFSRKISFRGKEVVFERSEV